jgi:hypothetical protein
MLLGGGDRRAVGSVVHPDVEDPPDPSRSGSAHELAGRRLADAQMGVGVDHPAESRCALGTGSNATAGRL